VSIVENFADLAAIRHHDEGGNVVFFIFPAHGVVPKTLFDNIKKSVLKVFPGMVFTRFNIINDTNLPVAFRVTVSKEDLDRVYLGCFDLLKYKRFWFLLLLLLVVTLTIVWFFAYASAN